MSVHTHASIPSLDGIRAVSIAIVFFAHARVMPFLPGGFGVTIFFFLSGFLITTLFYREADKFGSIDLRNFYIRRLLRLSPPLFITLSLVYGLVALGTLEGVIRPETIASQTLYFYNYYSTLSSDPTEGALGLNVLWSLSVEEHFYLIFPFLFLYIMKRQMTATHISIILVAILVWRIVRLSLLNSSDDTIYMATDTRFDAILFGAFLAVMVSEGSAARIFPEKSGKMWLLIISALSVLLFSFLYREPFFRSTARYSIQSLALMPLFYYAVFSPDLWLFRPLNWAAVKIVGVYSYTIYLIHTVVLGNLEASGVGFGNRIVFALLAFAICMGYAALLFRFVELPVKVARGRLLSRRFGET